MRFIAETEIVQSKKDKTVAKPRFKLKSFGGIFVILAFLCPIFDSLDKVAAASLENQRAEKNRQTGARREIKKKRKAKIKMNQPKLLPIAPGVWGTAGIVLTVEENVVKIQYPCADGEIKGRLTTDEQGYFSVVGVHLQRSGGPLRVGFEPQPQPARFEGKILGETMTLRVTLVENETLIGEFTLEQGKITRLHRCL